MLDCIHMYNTRTVYSTVGFSVRVLKTVYKTEMCLFEIPTHMQHLSPWIIANCYQSIAPAAYL